jgi:hypothetical protein
MILREITTMTEAQLEADVEIDVRGELLDQLKKLEQRRFHITEHVVLHGSNRETQSEFRHVRHQMRAVQIELSKLKTQEWRDDPAHFCRAFKFIARRELDDETYRLLVNETVLWLKQKHKKF